MPGHQHFGAEKVVRGETPHASADMNVTPLIDVRLRSRSRRASYGETSP